MKQVRAYRLGEFKIATTEGESTVDGLICEPFGIHEKASNLVKITHLKTGHATGEAESIIDAISLADQLAEIGNWDFKSFETKRFKSLSKVVVERFGRRGTFLS